MNHRVGIIKVQPNVLIVIKKPIAPPSLPNTFSILIAGSSKSSLKLKFR